ncbi:unnamed protein product [Sphagnum balticum]
MDWIADRLKEKKFPAPLKNDLIQLVTTVLNSSGLPNDQSVNSTKIFPHILLKARFSGIETKRVAIECLCVLVSVSHVEALRQLAEENSVMEILIYSFELGLDLDLAFKVLSAIVIIINLNIKYLEHAHRHDFFQILQRCEAQH